ncbi:hypothetical protein [Reichenbachiella sp. MALMAid0571]|uniref:hypothetical protein n=1 Tax=Reichenbachiella sp. MALMAid0571 TaxID=3143939 RepID=UPI0032DE886F
MDKEFREDITKIFTDSKKNENSLFELEKFCDKYSMSEDFKKLKKNILLQKCGILTNLKRFKEALQIIESLLIETKKTDVALFNLLSAKIDIYIKMGKTKKAKTLIGECLDGEIIFNENENLIFLKKLEELCTPQLIDQKYDALIQKIIYFLGFKESTVDLNINEVVHLVYNINLTSGKAYTKLMLDWHSSDVSNKKELVEEYIQKEKLEYYREMALAL